MKKEHTKRLVWLGVLCTLLVAGACWYTAAFNDSRFIVPMELSEYTFRVQDLPMIVSGILLLLYILYLLLWGIGSATVHKRKKAARTTRAVDPKLGFLGILGFAGFLGFWTYSINKTIFPFLFFMFFGFFGFFYEGKMSHTFMDERYKENKIKANMTANKIALTIIFLATLLLGQGGLLGNLEYTLIAMMVAVALSIALQIFLGEYLLYRYDHEEPFGESEE